MSTVIQAFEVRSGRKLTPLPCLAGSGWSVTTNADDSISATLRVDTKEARRLSLFTATELQCVGLVAIAEGAPRAAGPIYKRSFSGNTVTLHAGGFRRYLDSRPLLPYAARTTSLVDAEGNPRTSLDTVTTGLSLGSIARRYVEVVSEWPGTPPVNLPAPVAGTHERTVKAVDLKSTAALIDALSKVQGGPDVAFEPRWTEDGLGIVWQLVHGSETQPRLGNADASLVQWSTSAGHGVVFDLEVDEEAGGMTSEQWSVGGGSADKVVAAHAFDPTLLDAGFPLLQSVDTGNNDVTVEATLAARAQQGVALGRHVASFWKAGVRRGDERTSRLGDYWLGDLVTLNVGPDALFPAPGTYERRIAKIEGKVGQDYYGVTFAEAIA